MKLREMGWDCLPGSAGNRSVIRIHELVHI